jgi:hypothetical protein
LGPYSSNSKASDAPAFPRTPTTKVICAFECASPDSKIGALHIYGIAGCAVVLVEPLKLVALIIVDRGHWLAGTGMIIAAYAVSLLFVERLFKTVKPKLMTIGWFATMWTWFVGLRDKVIAWVSGRPVVEDQASR